MVAASAAPAIGLSEVQTLRLAHTEEKSSMSKGKPLTGADIEAWMLSVIPESFKDSEAFKMGFLRATFAQVLNGDTFTVKRIHNFHEHPKAESKPV